ncbi:hypothetical protein [Desulfobacter sp.]|uniref:hypothetical protein n=1 Tax=Desulfobacter sp. TaxID=2294 RepID=UPI000E9F7707|nr:hypothetical protein [Desulfobacter sp.]HBT88347.1 hypothetical protein [Desulfobacter sp.]
MSEEKTPVEIDTKKIQVDDEKLIDDAVQFINEKANETLYKGSIEIGEYILEHFFNGDPKLASSKNPKKPQSFNNLCDRDDLIVHPNQLGLMVRVASQEKYFIEKEIDTTALSYTHKASLVKMDNGLKKNNMVKKCIEKEWTTRQLEDAIKKHLNTLPSIPKPSLIRTTKKYITKIDEVLKTVKDADLDFNANDVSEMSDARRDTLRTNLTDLKNKIEEILDKEISKKCGKALEELTKIDEEIKAEKKKNPAKRGRLAKKK